MTFMVKNTDLVEVSGQHDEHPHENVVKKKEKETKATAEKPKKKWLDQYLKKSKDESEPDANLRELEVAIEQPLEVTSVRVKTRIVRDGSDAEAKGAYIVSQESRVETIDIESLDIEALDLDGDIDVEKLKEQLGIEGERNVEVRVIKKKMSASPTHFELEKETKPALDYELVLAEAKKLMVTDMRNQAVLEIVDYAIDNGDIVQAADLVDELSTPELRDTARARIGTGLARAGKPDAAFAVLEALEIDELAAPIRSAEVFHNMQHAENYGLSAKPSFDLAKIVKRSRDIAGQLSGGIKHLMKKNKITVIPGFATWIVSCLRKMKRFRKWPVSLLKNVALK